MEIIFNYKIDVGNLFLGIIKRCDCLNVLENYLLKQKNVIEEGLKIVLGNIIRGYCICWENDVNYFYKIIVFISLVYVVVGFGYIKSLILLKKYRCDINVKIKNNKIFLYYVVKI